MNQEEFGAYWAQAEVVTKEREGAYDVVVLRMPTEAVGQEGVAACLVGREGGFAGSFTVLRQGDSLHLKGRWLGPSGTWYAFEKELREDDVLTQLVHFAKDVVRQEDGFDPTEFGLRPPPTAS